MAIFKCKMCGGELEISNQTVATCEYCGTQQTLPKLDDERRSNLYDRANHFRRNNEFDKAMGIYEQILNEDGTDAEAYWSLVLCRYGIEYVEDPASHKRVPTVNRAQFTSIFDDDNYKSAIKNADTLQKGVYEAEAKTINEIQKGILAISQKEEPFDVFICYKETDNNGRRTHDSVLANDLYHQLTQEGFKVFFARITLEDKLGSAYEPYIFAALNSAKVMVVLGTKPEFFKAVWVKNEWSRYLALIKGGAKKMLIPAYKDMDPYDLPEEFSHLQAQDMSKLGFMQDLIRGIKKIAEADTPKNTVVKETVISGGNANTAPLLKRAFMFLEDGEWDRADEFCEQVLNLDPECAEAYLGKLMAELRTRTQDELQYLAEPFDHSNNYQKAIRFADEKLKTALTGYIEHINTRNENTRLEKIYTRAKGILSSACQGRECQEAAQLFESIGEYKDSAALARECYEKRNDIIYNRAKSMADSARRVSEYKEAAQLFESISEYKDSAELAQQYYDKAEELRKDAILAEGKYKMNKKLIPFYEEAIKTFESIPGWKNADELLAECHQRIEEIKAKEEADRLEAERRAELARQEAIKRAKRNKKIAVITAAVVCAIIAIVILLNTVIIPNVKYNKAISLLEAGNVVEAYEALISNKGHKKSAEKAASIYAKYEVAKMGEAEIGDYVFFGAYEQDHIYSNGKEAIEWLVLDVVDGKALVISKYALDNTKYNNGSADVTWETCTLRQWLNNDFLNEAFSAEEQALIPTVTVSADRNPECKTNPGNATQDQVFLLSITEVNKYFSSDIARRCKDTEYAKATTSFAANSLKTRWWWLRTPGETNNVVAAVQIAGETNEFGYDVNSAYGAVRPAMWIDLTAVQ